MGEQQISRVSPITLFYSYAHEDELLRNQLEKHLSLLHRQGLISEWHDRQILAGDEWAADIDQHLDTASIILLLISSDFLASNYCYDIEMKRALERHQRGEARVIPIILRPCDWRTSPFARLQCLPRDGKAVTMWQNSDEAFLTIAEGLRRVIERQRMPARPLSRVEQQNRTRLMKRMRSTWIKGVLERSLHQAALIALDLQEQPDALANPWQLEVQETNVPQHLLPAGTPLVQVYDEAEGELLILGEPGAGKTTLLLQLASDLLKRAEQDSTFPMPVFFTLSSWAEKRLPFTDWLIEELFTKYQVPRNLGRSWIKDDQLLLLLDGLDEVTQLHRSACIQAINAYRQEHNVVPVVLCSRKAEYEAQSTRVTLSKGVVIQPLTSQQIDDYLTQAGQQLETVRSLLREDQELQELTRTPLMLTILALAYQGKAVDDLVTRMPPEVQRLHVFGTYVERMLQRRAVSPYTPDQTKRWLAWLARQMVQHNQTEFYLERMQPAWLPDIQSLWFYRVLVGKLVFRLILGLSVGLFIDLNFGLSFGLISGSVIWLITGLIDIEDREIEPAEVITWSWESIRTSLVVFLIFGSLFALIGVLIGIFNGLLMGLLIGVIVLTSFLGIGLLVGLLIGLVAGWSSGMLNKHDRIMPNQGIWRSVRNGGLVGLVTTMLYALVSVPSFRLLDILQLYPYSRHGSYFGPYFGLFFGLAIGLLSGLHNGGVAFTQHVILRLLLWRSGSIPWNYSCFLDHAAERILLRKVGGGYIFIHRLLLDYFASLKTSSSEEASAVSASLQKTNEKG